MRESQSSTTLNSTSVASRPSTVIPSVDEMRGGREGTTGGNMPSACGPAVAASGPPPDVTVRMAINAVSYGGAAVLPHARRPSPRCFVPALSRRLAAPAIAADAPSLLQLTGKAPHTAAQVMTAALPSATNSSNWAPPATTSRKRTCTEDSHCCFPAVGRPPPSLGKGGGGSAAETRSTTCVSSSNLLELGKHISADIMAAGSNRSSNSSVSTTAAAASSWGASSEDGGEGTSDHQQQQHEQEEQRPTKLFRTAESRGCFSDALGAYEEDSALPPSKGNVPVSDDTTISQASTANVGLSCRSTSLSLLPNAPTARDQPQHQAESANTRTSPAAAEAVAEAKEGTAYNGQMDKHDSAAKASCKKTLVSSGIRSACGATARAGGGRNPAISSWVGSAGALTGSSSAVLKQHFKHGITTTGEKARFLRQQQQAKLRFKAVSALAAARGACSSGDAAAAARGEDVRKNEKRHYSLSSLTAASSYPRHFPLSVATADTGAGSLNSRTVGSSTSETVLRQQQHCYASRGARGLRSVLACSSSASALAIGGTERSVIGVDTQNGRAGSSHCISSALTTMRAAGRAAIISVPSFLQQRGTSVVSYAPGCSGIQMRTAIGTASQLMDKTFGSVSERCRLVICDTSAAYGEDAGLDNVHNTKLAQFCYDQAAFKADKAQPGDYTVNSRRLTPEGRDLLVCVVNKVAAQLAQNTAATAAASASNANGGSSSSSSSSASSFSSSSSQGKADGYTTPTSDPLSPRAAATVAIAIQLFDRFMQVVYQNDLHYGIGAEHCLHPLHGLSALAALPATATTTGGGGGTGNVSSGIVATTSAGASGALSNSNHTHSSNNSSNSHNNIGGSNNVSYSLLNQLIAIACFCFADRVEAIYAYEYAAVLEAWRQQSPAGLTQAWKLAGTTATSGGSGGQLSTAVLKEKLMHIERKIISHVPPNGGNVSVAPLSELVESLLNVAIQFAAADASSTNPSITISEDGALSEASTAPSPTSVSKKSKDSNRDEKSAESNRNEINSTFTRRYEEQQQRGSHTKQQGTALSLLQRREAAAANFSDPAEKEETEIQQDKQLLHQEKKKQMPPSRPGVGGISSVAEEKGELSPAVSRYTGAGIVTRGHSCRRGLSAACYGQGRSVISGATIAASSSYFAGAVTAAGGTTTREKCRYCQREWLSSQGEEAAFYRSSRVCRSCFAKKLQLSGSTSAGAAVSATTTPLNTRYLASDCAAAKETAAATHPYALRVRMSGSNSSDVPRLIAQLLVRLGQLDRRICLDFRPSVIAAAAVHIALLPRQGDPTQRFSPLSPAARAIAVKAVVAAGGAACCRLVRRCQSMLMHKWVKVRGAMAIVQRSNNAAGNSANADAATNSASGAVSTAAGAPSAPRETTTIGIGTAALAGGRASLTVSLSERLVAEWALSRLTLPAHRHMLEVLHHLADIWTTYATASIRSRAAAAVAAAAAAARKQQQQAWANTTAEQDPTGSGALKRGAALSDAQQPGASINRTAGEILSYKCSSSSSTIGGGGGHPHYKYQFLYHPRPGKSRSGGSSTSTDEFMSATRRTEGETTRRRAAAGGIGTALTQQGLLMSLSRKEENCRGNAPGSKTKLLPPLNSALIRNTSSLHASVSSSSFPTFAGLQKELRMMERASISLRRLQKLSLEAAGREDNRNQLLLQ